MGTQRRADAAALAERFGPIPDKLKTYVKEQNRLHKLIAQALKTGPKTVPELAGATSEPSHILLWHLMALKKYGRVVEVERRGDYCAYALASKD